MTFPRPGTHSGHFQNPLAAFTAGVGQTCRPMAPQAPTAVPLTTTRTTNPSLSPSSLPPELQSALDNLLRALNGGLPTMQAPPPRNGSARSPRPGTPAPGFAGLPGGTTAVDAKIAALNQANDPQLATTLRTLGQTPTGRHLLAKVEGDVDIYTLQAASALGVPEAAAFRQRTLIGLWTRDRDGETIVVRNPGDVATTGHEIAHSLGADEPQADAISATLEREIRQLGA